jgi:hypothetical protein
VGSNNAQTAVFPFPAAATVITTPLLQDSLCAVEAKLSATAESQVEIFFS